MKKKLKQKKLVFYCFFWPWGQISYVILFYSNYKTFLMTCIHRNHNTSLHSYYKSTVHSTSKYLQVSRTNGYSKRKSTVGHWRKHTLTYTYTVLYIHTVHIYIYIYIYIYIPGNPVCRYILYIWEIKIEKQKIKIKVKIDDRMWVNLQSSLWIGKMIMPTNISWKDTNYIRMFCYT